jgi:transcriptional regulator with XRE-family HTH domain
MQDRIDTKGSRDGLNRSFALVDACQLRAARALLGLSQSRLAEFAGISVPTLKRAEAGGPIKVAATSVSAIVRALEQAGAEFIPENGGGAGVRLRKQEGADGHAAP